MLNSLSKQIRAALLVVLIVAGAALLLPGQALAQPTVTGSDCSGCHANVLSFPNPAQRSSPDPTIDWGVIIGGTPTSGSPASITVNENSTFELEYIIREMTQVDGTKDVSMRTMVGLPAATWSVGATSIVQNTGLTGWNANYEAMPWDPADSADFSTWFPNSPIPREPDAATSSWTANGRAFYDDASANDLDGVAEKMGTDVLITVPSGIGSASPGTPYEIRIVGIGHYRDASAKAAKGHVSAVITVNVVSGGGDSTPPSIGTVTPSNQDDGTYVDGTFDLTATVTEANTVTAADCEVCVSTDGTCDTEWTNVGAALGGAAPNYTCSWTALGPYADTASLTINIRATDDSANTGTGTPVTRTVDAAGPVQGTTPVLTATTGAVGAIDLSWSVATDAGSGLEAGTTYRIRQLPGTTAPNADCTSDGTEIYASTGTSTTDTGLTEGADFAYRLCTYDAFGQLTSGQTATAAAGAAGPTPPDTTISAPVASEVLSASPYTISGTAVAGTNPLQDILISTDGGGTYPNTTTGASWTWDWTLPSEDYVAHTIMAKARDNTLLEDPSPASVAIFVDTVVPTGLSLNSPADGAPGVSTTPSLQVNAASDGNPTIEYFIEVAEDSGFTVNAQNSGWQAATSWTPGVALSAGTLHYWRATARDGAGNTTSPTANRTFTTAAGCVPAQPTVSLAPAAQTIPNDGGLVVYTLTVTNNDSACPDATFSLSANDTDPSAAFYSSVLSKSSMTIASGGSDTATVTVQVLPGNDAVTNDTTVTATDSPDHDPPVVSSAVTTTVTLGGGCVGTGVQPNASAGGTLILGR